MLTPLRTGRLLGSLLPLLLLSLFLTAATASARPRSLQELADINKKLTESGIQYGQIPSLYRPRFDRMQDAGLSMNADDVVFVVMLPDGPRIYPQKYLVWHQVINEVVDDHAYAVTYSPITGGFAAYDASMGGLNLIFDAEGRLYDGNSVLIDRNSGSLWLQELGMAFDGSLLGRGMPLVPSYWTTWGPARRCFPNAKVLSRPPGRRPYGRDPYGDYRKDDTYYTNDELVYPVERIDRRFPRKTPMFCLEHQGALIAVDIGYVKKKGAVNFFVGPSALLAVHDKKLDVVRVFNRQVWAEPFLFVYSGNQLIDITTRSIWDPATGICLEGNLKGASLPQYYGSYSMWFAWASMNPETLFIPGPGEVPENLLQISPLGQPPQGMQTGGLPGQPSGGQAAAPGVMTAPGVPAGALPQSLPQGRYQNAPYPGQAAPRASAPLAVPGSVPGSAPATAAGQPAAPLTGAVPGAGAVPAAPAGRTAGALPQPAGAPAPAYGISPGGYAPPPPLAAPANTAPANMTPAGTAPAATPPTGGTPGGSTGVGAVVPPGAAMAPLPMPAPPAAAAPGQN